MNRARRTDLPGLTQHVMIRSIPEVDLFRGDADKRSLALRIARVLETEDVRITFASFMSNHVHLELQLGDASVSRFMHRVGTGYVLTYNLTHGRHGRLLDDRFLSKVVDTDE